MSKPEEEAVTDFGDARDQGDHTSCSAKCVHAPSSAFWRTSVSPARIIASPTAR